MSNIGQIIELQNHVVAAMDPAADLEGGIQIRFPLCKYRFCWGSNHIVVYVWVGTWAPSRPLLVERCAPMFFNIVLPHLAKKIPWLADAMRGPA